MEKRRLTLRRSRASSGYSRASSIVAAENLHLRRRSNPCSYLAVSASVLVQGTPVRSMRAARCDVGARIPMGSWGMVPRRLRVHSLTNSLGVQEYELRMNSVSRLLLSLGERSWPGSGRGNGKVQLGPYMLANRLSYFLYGSMPDQSLFDAAGRGQLGTDADIDAQARRMLNDPKARVMVADFISDLLDLEFLPVRPKDENVYSMYNATLQEAMQVEAENFATSIILSRSGKFDDLMTSTATSLNQPLAALYGVSGISGQNFREANWNTGQRGGLLTLAAFLANTGAADGSDPPRRGKLVFTRFLCTDLPPPPNELPPVAEATPGVTTRQRFEEHGQLDCARGCHGILDNIGFAFEHFDGVGAYRATDMGAPVDASGSFAFDDTTAVSYTNALEFQQALVASASSVAAVSSGKRSRYAVECAALFTSTCNTVSFSRWKTSASSSSVNVCS